MPDLNKFCERMRYWCEDGNLGYDQSNRYDVREGGETDCSWLVVHALKEADFDTGAASWTGNMSSELCARGWKRVAADGNPRKGDILLNDANHVAVWLGSKLAQASIDENGNISGGQAGDQSGWETNTRGYYDYPWDCYLRWQGGSSSTSSAPASLPKPKMRIYRQGKWRGWKQVPCTRGLAGVPVYDFQAKNLGPGGWFQLTLEGGEVLPRNTCNTAHAKKVIGVTMYYVTPDPASTGYYAVQYRVKTAAGQWLKWESDDDDGGAGDDRNAVCRVQAKLVKL